jgi:hypothetical protein|tara:strand:+ start:17604 stop:18629 length:1026 start_codon:yes stop_codon:yes gene_type:complete
VLSNQIKLFTLVLLTILPLTLSAHHSRSEFSSEVIEIEGELLDVLWRNPHAGLQIKVTSDAGVDEVWRVETFASPNLFSRMGVNEEHFNIGQRIRVAGSVSEKRPLYFLGLNALFENGSEAVLTATNEPRWSQDHVGGSDQSVVDLSRMVDAASENKKIFRVWSIAGRAVGTARYTPYSDTSRAAMAVWDPLTAPVAQCETPGMPIPMTQPLSFVIEDQGDTIKLTTEYFGVERTIHVGDNLPAPETQAASHLGYSRGHWQDELTFVVETSRINYPYYSSSGALQGEDLSTMEYFRLSEDQTELAYRIEIEDSLALTGTAYNERLFVALGEEFIELGCTLF